MLQLTNHTPFNSTITLCQDEQGVDALYIVLKATFSFAQGIVLAKEQIPLIVDDEYWNTAETSSLRYASDMHLCKKGTDIIVNGHAYAPEQKPITWLDCGIKVAHYSKTIRVFGDRYWQDSWRGKKISAPEPFTQIPLIYENAYGGAYWEPEKETRAQKKVVHASNPVGRGYRGGRKTQAINADRLPNLEDPHHLIQRPADQPPPACFGFIAPNWKPRIDFAGTYDDLWQKQRAPYLPTDFDSQFFHSAAKALTCDGFLQGGELVTLLHLTPNEFLNFELPKCEVTCEIKMADGIKIPPLNLETLLFEPDQRLFSLTWRGKFQCDKQTFKINEVHLTSKMDEEVEIAQ